MDIVNKKNGASILKAPFFIHINICKSLSFLVDAMHPFSQQGDKHKEKGCCT